MTPDRPGPAIDARWHKTILPFVTEIRYHRGTHTVQSPPAPSKGIAMSTGNPWGRPSAGVGGYAGSEPRGLRKRFAGKEPKRSRLQKLHRTILEIVPQAEQVIRLELTRFG